MTITLTPVDANTALWQDLYNLVNQLVTVEGQNNVTVDLTANGSSSVGNGFVQGILGSNLLAATTLRGGNVQSSGLLTLGSNVSLNVSFSFIAGNVVANSTVLSVGNVVTNTTSIAIDATVHSAVDISVNAISTTLIDAFPMASFRAAEYQLAVKDNNANNYSAAKILVLHDGGSAYITEWAQLISNSTVGTFSATTNATHLIVNYLPATSNNVTLKGYRLATTV